MIAVCIKTFYDSAKKKVIPVGMKQDIDPKSMTAKYFGKISPLGDKDPAENPVMTEEQYQEMRAAGAFGNGKKLLKKLQKDSVKNADKLEILAEGLKGKNAKAEAAKKKAAKKKAAAEQEEADKAAAAEAEAAAKAAAETSK